MTQPYGDRGGPRRTRDDPAALVTDDDARRIIADGDAERLVDCALRLATEADRRNVTQTSVRRLFGEARRIELLWDQAAFHARTQGNDELARQASRRAVLLKPRLRYQVARDPKLRVVQQNLEPLLNEVDGDRVRYKRFVEFFEALVAYLKPSGR